MYDADAHREYETDDGTPCRPCDAHAEEFDKYEVQNQVEGSTGHHRHHYQARVAVGFDEALQSEAHYRWDGAQGHYMHEFNGQIVEPAAAGADE